MERVHQKSSLTETGHLILAAYDLGEDLLWGRYERQLPLCAFTNNGLNCRKCFQGPCRISPFGDEPSQGVCGADRDQIVMESLFQVTLEGVLETARSVSLLRTDGADRSFPEITSGLPQGTQKRLSKMGFLPLRKMDLFEVENSYFSHKGYLPETLRDLTRLGLIHYGLLKEAESSINRAPLEGSPLHTDGVNILILGQPPMGFLQSVEQEALKSGEKKINLLSQGTNKLPLTRAASDHGSPELALGMNLDALVISRNAFLPGLERLAKRYDIPIVLVEKSKPVSEAASEVIQQALDHASRAAPRIPSRVKTGNSGRAAHPVLDKGTELKKALESGHIRGLAVLFGETNVKQAFFERTLALMEAALTARCLVLLGGDLGSEIDLLSAELGKRNPGQLSRFASDLEKEGVTPFSTFGSPFEIPRVVSLLKHLIGEREIDAFPVIMAFPEFYRASTWAAAVSFLSFGFSVQIGTRLPFWGSPSMTEVILKDWPNLMGGKLLVSPALPDPKAQAEEMVSYLRARKLE